MVAQRTPLLIPSETQTREFDAKLLLACLGTERGFPTIVGCRTDIHLNINRLPRSIYLSKDVRFSSRKMFGIMDRLGWPIVALDEEAPFFLSRDSYLQMRVNKEVLAHTRQLYAWGPVNAEAWRQCPYFHGAPIFETGNPRVDMMRPELRGFFADEVASIRDRLGRFILINTNFGSVNHYYANLSKPPPVQAASSEGASAAKAFMAGFVEFRRAIFNHFLELVPQLCRAFPDHLVVIRPHPAENHDTWRKAGEGHANLRVIHEGSVIPWLLATEVALHNGCTTGFEAYLLDASVIAFQPLTSEPYDMKLPNELSHKTVGIDDTIDAVRAAISGNLLADEAELRRRRARAEAHVAALDGAFAAERILDHLDRFEAAGLPPVPPLHRRLSGRAAAFIRRQGKLRNANIPGHKNNISYTRHRFPGISLPEVERRIRLFQGLLGRFDRIRATELGENIFQISPG